jgi:outer membrane protein
MTLLAPLALSAALAAAPAASRVVHLEEAVRSAVENHPQLREARAGTEAASARADQARAGLLPRVGLTAGPSIRGEGSSAGGGSGPTSSLGADLSASQLLFDFGQTWGRWRAAQAGAEAQRASEGTTQQQLILGARTAFFGARTQRDLVRVARETLANQQRHLEQVQGFVEVGTRARIDLAQIRTDRANAAVQLINAENAYETAKVQLNQAMGVEADTDYDLGDETLGPVAGEDASTDELLKEALAARPEVAALEAQVRAQQLNVEALSGGYWPSFGVSTGAGAGAGAGALGWNWSAQLTMNWQLFQGLATTAQVREARAALSSAEAQRDLLRQQVRLQVDQARLAVRGAKAALAAAGEALAAARERLELAEGRYQTGAGSILELGDAQVALTTAAAQEVRAEANVALARAQLIQALGRSR